IYGDAEAICAEMSSGRVTVKGNASISAMRNSEGKIYVEGDCEIFNNFGMYLNCEAKIYQKGKKIWPE
ncbi:hypothetical protein HY837_06045, partial [archaeon]|nr:hypothetical protein [archaeon]